MPYILIFIACCFTGQLFCQQSFTLLVLDAASSAPVPYVSVGVPSLSTGTVGNAEGRCSLSIPTGEVEVLVSALGYRSSKYLIKAQGKLDTIFLAPDPIMAPEVQLNARTLDQEVVLGAFNETRGGSVSFGNAQLGTELGAVIPIERETYLKSAHFRLNHAKGDSLLLRLNLYDFSGDTIGRNILTENVMIREKQRTGDFVIDLAAYELLVDHPVLFSLEWLRDYDELGNKAITFEVKKVKRGKGTFIRFYSNGPYEQLAYRKRYQPCFYLKGITSGAGF